MNRRQLLEARREKHEYYLRRCLGPGFSLEVQGGRAILTGLEGGLEVRFPARWLLEFDALRRLGVVADRTPAPFGWCDVRARRFLPNGAV